MNAIGTDVISRWFISNTTKHNASHARQSSTDPAPEEKIPDEQSDAEAPSAAATTASPLNSTKIPISVPLSLSVLNSSSCQEQPPFLMLTPVQSCMLHGWLNPRRTLQWDDICRNSSLTVKKCLRHGITASELKRLQPDVRMWIRHKGASLADVPAMLEWPLHPVLDLKANISDLATNHYPASVMMKLGISYGFMRNYMRMDDDWMRVLHYTPAEWAEMGFTREDAAKMGRKRVEWVFSTPYDALVVQVSSSLR